MQFVHHVLAGALALFVTFSLAATGAQALTITDTVDQSGFDGASASPFPLTFEPWDFSGQPLADLLTLGSLSITLTMTDGDTGLGDIDFNDFTLGLDGIDAGIVLNGFNDGQTLTLNFMGAPINSASILAALQIDGQLIGTIFDIDPDDNLITLPRTSTTTLSLTGTAIPAPTGVAVGVLGMAMLALRRRRSLAGA